jgi:hypothetical protein
VHSISTTQPTFDLSSFVELRGIIVEVQWFGTTAAVEAVVCVWFHVVVGRRLSGIGNRSAASKFKSNFDDEDTT